MTTEHKNQLLEFFEHGSGVAANQPLKIQVLTDPNIWHGRMYLNQGKTILSFESEKSVDEVVEKITKLAVTRLGFSNDPSEYEVVHVDQFAEA